MVVSPCGPLKPGFDNNKYLVAQKKAILARLNKFDKLYFEWGGHLLYDGHASRVLPGYNPENKLKLIKSLGKDVAVVYCVSAKELEKKVTWSDTGLLLDELSLKEVKELRKKGVNVVGYTINRFKGEETAIKFANKLKKLGENFVFTSEIKGYPNNLKNVFGKNGFESQPLLDIPHKIIAVTGAGANNGKMFFCLSQIYQYHKFGIDAGFAKFETFPIWNLSVNHEVNVAYEAATADIQDKVMIDPFHKKSYGINAVNYNRDIENFAILKKIIKRIDGKKNFMSKYNSPTDMGLNMAKEGIVNDELVREASRQEILRRYESFKKKVFKGEKEATLLRMKEIMLKIKWPA